MILLLDIGNSSVNSAVLAHGELRPAGAFLHGCGDFDALAREAWHELPAPARVVVSNVAGPAMGERLSDWCGQNWQVKPQFMLATDKAFGVTNAYARPADLGADRWSALIGARASCSNAVCVVDCGTAVTLDFLAASGDHLGGLILPGIAMLEQMLLNTTAGIDFSQQPEVSKLFATGTDDAVHGGAVYMVAAAIDRIVADMGAVCGCIPGVLISGGDAGKVAPLLAGEPRHEPDLVLKGLSILAGES